MTEPTYIARRRRWTPRNVALFAVFFVLGHIAGYPLAIFGLGLIYGAGS